MKEFLLNLLGIKPQPILKDGGEIQTEFIWTNAVTSYWVFVYIFAVAAVLYGVFWLYRREMQGTPKVIRMGLAVFRCVVMLLLLIVLLGPALSVSQSQSVEPYILVLIDDSASMRMKDRFRETDSERHVAAFLGQSPGEAKNLDLTRMELVERVLKKDDGRFLRGLSEQGNVLLYRFSNTFTPINVVGRTQTEGEADDGSVHMPAFPCEAGGAADTIAAHL